MALKNLKSNLAVGDLATLSAADLTFGKGTAYDRPNQEFSDEPFIKGGIDLGGTSRLNSITGGFIRGGLLMHAERLLQDTERIGTFLISNRGLTWNAKQLGLQKSNPKVSEPSFPDSVANQRQWNFGVNTLAQVAGQGTGLHIKREGISPLDKSGYIDEKKFKNNYKKDENKNRLLFLYDNHITRPKAKEEEKKTGIAGFFQGVKKFFAKPGEELYSYNGGPGSTYGIGQTKIQKYDPTPAFEDLGVKSHFGFEDPIPLFSVSNIINNRPLENVLGIPKDDLNNLAKRDKNFDTTRDQHTKFDSHILNGTSRVKNYLKTLGKTGATDYSKLRREERVNLGNPGSSPGDTTIDLINALDVFSSDQDFSPDKIKDLIRFRIEAVNPENPTQSNVMVFRAFLDSMNDTFSAQYNDFSYNGRAENFYTYNGFDREITFSFKIAAQSSREMRPLYRKLNYLLSNTAPEYNTTSNRIMTPFMRLTIGSYFQQLPGVLKSVGITWNKDYPWEICLNAPEGEIDKDLFVLPHVLDVNVTYLPIHDFLPQKSIHSPFIIPHKDSPITNGKEGRKSWNREPIPTATELGLVPVVSSS